MANNEYDPMNPDSEMQTSSIASTLQFAPFQTAPPLYQNQPPPPQPSMPPQPQMPPQPSAAPMAPWLLNAPQQIQQIHQTPPMPFPTTIPPPPFQPIPPKSYNQPPPPPQAVIPAPPDSVIPPPPPPLESVDENKNDDTYESAYSPSQAEDGEDEMKHELEKRERNAILLAEQKQRDIEHLIAIKEREANDHTKRMEMENKKLEELKRRKIMSGFGPIKLKKIKMKGFEAEDDAGDEKIETDGVKEVKSSSHKITHDNTAVEEISEEKIKFMTQIASYLTHNPSQGALFLKEKRNDKNYDFLFDVERLTKESKKFREISEKFQAEKNVQNIVNDPVQKYINNALPISAPISIPTIMKSAAVDYSLLNPFINAAVAPTGINYTGLNSAGIISTGIAAATVFAKSSSSGSSGSSTSVSYGSASVTGNNGSNNSSSSSGSNSSSGTVSTPQSVEIPHTDVSKSGRRNRWGPSVGTTVATPTPAPTPVPVVKVTKMSESVINYDEVNVERDRIRAVQIRIV